MKKLLFYIILVLSVVSCVNRSTKVESICKDSPEGAFEAFVEAVEKRDIASLKGLSATDFLYYDTLMTTYKKPTIALVPKNADGAYGIFERGGAVIYYIYIQENDIPRDVKVLMLQNDSGCYKVWNISQIPASSRDELLKK